MDPLMDPESRAWAARFGLGRRRGQLAGLSAAERHDLATQAADDALMGDQEMSLVDGLLGPEEPELGCDDCFAELDRYVELELAGEDADARLPGFHAHLAGCLACREEHESLRALLAGEGG